MNSARIAVLLHNLGGGLETVVLNLLHGLTYSPYAIDLVVDSGAGLEPEKIPAGVRLIDLKTPIAPSFKNSLALILPLVRYLRRERPIALFSHLIFVNVTVAIARTLAGVPLHLTLVEHNPLFRQSSRANEPTSRLLTALMRWWYPRVDRAAAVSRSMAAALEASLDLPPGSIATLYNPAIDPDFAAKANAPLDHLWFADSEPPVILGVGRLVAAKDFPLLLRAFARLRQQRQAKLMILGEGNERSRLEAIVHELGLETEVALPGWATNPYAYMSRARLCCLSSRWEGLPTVLIEAMACGCQVVATDCPHGPREILEGGKYGRLVPVGDLEALTAALQDAIDRPIETVRLLDRARAFSTERAVAEYLKPLVSDFAKT